MNPIIIRWLAMVFSLGAWAGVAAVVLTYLGRGPLSRGWHRRSGAAPGFLTLAIRLGG